MSNSKIQLKDKGCQALYKSKFQQTTASTELEDLGKKKRNEQRAFKAPVTKFKLAEDLSHP